MSLAAKTHIVARVRAVVVPDERELMKCSLLREARDACRCAREEVRRCYSCPRIRVTENSLEDVRVRSDGRRSDLKATVSTTRSITFISVVCSVCVTQYTFSSSDQSLGLNV